MNPRDLDEFGSWHPEHWDAVTLAYLKTDAGKQMLALLKAAPQLLVAAKDARRTLVDAYEIASDRRQSIRLLTEALAKAEGK